MRREPVRPLLERGLVIVTGKGGTGKTSVVAALALAAARAGRRVLAVETGREEHLARLFEEKPRPCGYAGRELRPGLYALRIDPYEALAEYLGLQLKVSGLVRSLVRNRGFRQLMDASPGWRELITLGKVWHLRQQRDDTGRPLYDLLLVDAPATGHGVTFLDVPRVVVSAVRAGPLRRHATLVAEMVADPEATVLLPVALAEELPARETVELVARVRDQLGVAVDRVVVNSVLARPFPAEVPDLDTRLARLPAEPPLPGLPAPKVLARFAAHLRSRYELNQHHLAEIGRATRLPCVALPYLPGGIRGERDLAVLADALVAAATAAAA